MASLGSLMFVILLSFYVTNYKVFGDDDESKHVQYFDPNFRRLRELAALGLRHVESEHTRRHALHELLGFEKLVEFRDRSEYVLLLQIAPTNCDKDSTSERCGIDPSRLSICRINYVVTESKIPNLTWPPTPGPAEEMITGNNCTHSQIFPEVDESLPSQLPPKETTPKKTKVHRKLAYFGAVWKDIVAF